MANKDTYIVLIVLAFYAVFNLSTLCLTVIAKYLFILMMMTMTTTAVRHFCDFMGANAEVRLQGKLILAL